MSTSINVFFQAYINLITAHNQTVWIYVRISNFYNPIKFSLVQNSKHLGYTKFRLKATQSILNSDYSIASLF